MSDAAWIGRMRMGISERLQQIEAREKGATTYDDLEFRILSTGMFTDSDTEFLVSSRQDIPLLLVLVKEAMAGLEPIADKYRFPVIRASLQERLNAGDQEIAGLISELSRVGMLAAATLERMERIADE